MKGQARYAFVAGVSFRTFFAGGALGPGRAGGTDRPSLTYRTSGTSGACRTRGTNRTRPAYRA